MAVPLASEKQITGVISVVSESGAKGWVSSMVSLSTQPLLSSTSMIYTPMKRSVRSSLTAALLQSNTYPPFPPLTVMSINPSFPPKQEMFPELSVIVTGVAG